MSTIPISNVRSFSSIKQYTRGVLFYVKRGLLALVAFLVALPILGFTYETLAAASDAQRFPAPGQLVMVNGHQMHCMVYSLYSGS
jgi:hypothetical protein